MLLKTRRHVNDDLHLFLIHYFLATKGLLYCLLAVVLINTHLQAIREVWGFPNLRIVKALYVDESAKLFMN